MKSPAQSKARKWWIIGGTLLIAAIVFIAWGQWIVSRYPRVTLPHGRIGLLEPVTDGKVRLHPYVGSGAVKHALVRYGLPIPFAFLFGADPKDDAILQIRLQIPQRISSAGQTIHDDEQSLEWIMSGGSSITHSVTACGILQYEAIAYDPTGNWAVDEVDVLYVRGNRIDGFQFKLPVPPPWVKTVRIAIVENPEPAQPSWGSCTGAPADICWFFDIASPRFDSQAKQPPSPVAAPFQPVSTSVGNTSATISSYVYPVRVTPDTDLSSGPQTWIPPGMGTKWYGPPMIAMDLDHEFTPTTGTFAQARIPHRHLELELLIPGESAMDPHYEFPDLVAPEPRVRIFHPFILGSTLPRGLGATFNRADEPPLRSIDAEFPWPPKDSTTSTGDSLESIRVSNPDIRLKVVSYGWRPARDRAEAERNDPFPMDTIVFEANTDPGFLRSHEVECSATLVLADGRVLIPQESFQNTRTRPTPGSIRFGASGFFPPNTDPSTMLTTGVLKARIGVVRKDLLKLEPLVPQIQMPPVP